MYKEQWHINCSIRKWVIVMGRKLIELTGGVCAILVALGMWVWTDGTDPVAYAVDGTASLSVQCSAPDSVAFVPEVVYTVQPRSSPTALSSYKAILTGPVNGQDSIVTRSHWQTPQTIIIAHATPMMKLAGLQCKDTSASTLYVGLDKMQLGHEVSITTPHLTQKLTTPLVAGQTDSLFGVRGQISGTPLQDGRDADHHLNGEIAFGGDSATTGGTKTIFQFSINTVTPNLRPQLHFTFAAH